ncbi:YoaK family protein [Streptomyces sp. NPDC051907]|uniref:YoaK family protein n=1 Tax=Streptomyces sp. NPDC051907 TaxID=3155284 RepID=UPI00342FD311
MDTTRPELTSLMAGLTLTTGMLDAVTLLALGPAFTAMQTGNLLFLGFGLAGQGGVQTVIPAISLAAFVLGAMLGARLESLLDARGRRWLVLGVFVEAALLAGAGFLAWGLERAAGDPSARHAAVIAVVALAMGMHNVTTMRAHVPDLPTTVATRAMTALVSGSPLGHDASLGYGSRAWMRRSVAILALFAGAVLGAWLLRAHWSPAAVLLLVAGLVLAMATAFATTARRRAPLET